MYKRIVSIAILLVTWLLAVNSMAEERVVATNISFVDQAKFTLLIYRAFEEDGAFKFTRIALPAYPDLTNNAPFEFRTCTLKDKEFSQLQMILDDIKNDKERETKSTSLAKFIPYWTHFLVLNDQGGSISLYSGMEGPNSELIGSNNADKFNNFIMSYEGNCILPSAITLNYKERTDKTQALLLELLSIPGLEIMRGTIVRGLCALGYYDPHFIEDNDPKVRGAFISCSADFLAPKAGEWVMIGLDDTDEFVVLLSIYSYLGLPDKLKTKELRMKVNESLIKHHDFYTTNKFGKQYPFRDIEDLIRSKEQK